MARLADLLHRAEWPDPVFDSDTVARWPDGHLRRLTALGLVAETGPAESVVCDACAGDHVERVARIDLPNRPVRQFIRCPEEGLVEVPAERLRRWVLRLPQLVRQVAAAVGATAGPVERVPGRVWKLGTVRAAGRAWPAFLAVGLTRPDGAAVATQVPELRSGTTVVFVPSTVPSASVWSSPSHPIVVPLTDLLTLEPDGLTADRLVLESALTPVGGSLRSAPSRVFPTPPGTTWEQVHLTVEDHHLTVQVGDTVERFGFQDAGFENRRTKVPNNDWVVLQTLARFGGVLGTGDRTRTKSGSLRQQVSSLGKQLRGLLGIEADPFHRTGKGESYRTRFHIRPAEGLVYPTPEGATWDDVTVTEVQVGVVEVDVANGGDRRRLYTLVELGLTGPDHAPSPAGSTLVEVLRAGGRVTRPEGDSGMLTLGSALTRFFQLANSPFEFLPKRSVWAARFEAASVVPPSDR